MSASETYAARVDAVLAQRTRLRGPQPPGDLFGNLPPDHPLLKSDSAQSLSPNLAILASYLHPDDVLVDVGGGAGRINLSFACHCREIINVDPSAAMGVGFTANAARLGITNVRFIHGAWPLADAPKGDIVLVNNVTYFTRDIVPFLLGLEASAGRRVLLTVNSPPPPTYNRQLYNLVYGEEEATLPGHAELATVLWDLGRLPNIRVLPDATVVPFPPIPTREAAIHNALVRFAGEQWAFWPLAPDTAARVRQVLDAQFDTLFTATSAGFVPRWAPKGHELLITWATHGHAA